MFVTKVNCISCWPEILQWGLYESGGSSTNREVKELDVLWYENGENHKQFSEYHGKYLDRVTHV